MSRIIVDSIRNSSASSDGITLSSDGKVAFANTSTGKVAQVIQVVKTSKQSVQSQTMVDITGFELTITPSSASSVTDLPSLSNAPAESSIDTTVPAYAE